MVKAAPRQVIGNVREAVKHCSLDEFIVGEDGLSSGDRRTAFLGMSRTGTIVRTLPFVSKMFIAFD